MKIFAIRKGQEPIAANVVEITEAEIANLPKHMIDTLRNGMVTFDNDKGTDVFGNSEAHLLEWFTHGKPYVGTKRQSVVD
jgi:hypothetical protein